MGKKSILGSRAGVYVEVISSRVRGRGTITPPLHVPPLPSQTLRHWRYIKMYDVLHYVNDIRNCLGLSISKAVIGRIVFGSSQTIKMAPIFLLKSCIIRTLPLPG